MVDTGKILFGWVHMWLFEDDSVQLVSGVHRPVARGGISQLEWSIQVSFLSGSSEPALVCTASHERIESEWHFEPSLCPKPSDSHDFTCLPALAELSPTVSAFVTRRIYTATYACVRACIPPTSAHVRPTYGQPTACLNRSAPHLITSANASSFPSPLLFCSPS